MANIVRLSVYVTARKHMEGYRQSRDRQFPGTPPTTTLIMVAGLVRPEFVIEIEAIAAAPEQRMMFGIGPGASRRAARGLALLCFVGERMQRFGR